MGGLSRMVRGAFAMYRWYSTMVSLVAPAAGDSGSMPERSGLWRPAVCCTRLIVIEYLGIIEVVLFCVPPSVPMT